MVLAQWGADWIFIKCGCGIVSLPSNFIRIEFYCWRDKLLPWVMGLAIRMEDFRGSFMKIFNTFYEAHNAILLWSNSKEITSLGLISDSSLRAFVASPFPRKELVTQFKYTQPFHNKWFIFHANICTVRYTCLNHILEIFTTERVNRLQDKRNLTRIQITHNLIAHLRIIHKVRVHRIRRYLSKSPINVKYQLDPLVYSRWV